MIKEEPNGSIECSMVHLHRKDPTIENLENHKQSFIPSDLEDGSNINDDDNIMELFDDEHLDNDDNDEPMFAKSPGPDVITKWFAQRDGDPLQKNTEYEDIVYDENSDIKHLEQKLDLQAKEHDGYYDEKIPKNANKCSISSTESISTNQANQIIDNYMGGDKVFIQGLKLEQETHRRENDHHFETISYNMPDSPIWHHFTHGLRQRHTNKNSDGVQTFTKVRKCLTLDYCSPISRLKESNKKTNDEGASEHSRSKSEEPIKDVNKDVQFIIRIMILKISIVMSIVGFCISQASENLLNAKINYVTSTNEYLVEHRNDIGFIFFLGCNLVLALGAFLPVLYRPYSAGSGIAEAKAVLNGIVLPKATDLTTALCKAISVIFSGAASLPVGLEGPMIFMGLSIGENSQKFLPNSKFVPNTVILKSNRYKRDFACIGATCGVTSAFFTPIGGVLFAMEEGSSFWSMLLAKRSFIAACVTVIFSYLFMYALGKMPLINIVCKFHGYPGEQPRALPTFVPIDYIGFAIMGIIGGMVGSIWNELNRMLNMSRNKKLIKGRPALKCLELLTITALVSALMWYLPILYMQCTSIEALPSQYEDFYRTFGCSEGEFNQLATLLLNPPSSIGINLLFWEHSNSFSAITCVIAGTVYLLTLLLLFGTSIGMGIFVPLLFVGASYGRALALVCNFGNTDIDVTTYAMVGSVALLAGVARIHISLTVIMITSTGLPYLVTPFMIATIFANRLGDTLFGRPGIYDIILELRKIPFLEQEVPENILFRGLKAKDIMSTPLVSLQPELLVKDAINYLEQYEFADFPVVDPKRNFVLLGIISRSILLQILNHKELFYKKEQKNNHKAFTFEYMREQLQRKNKMPSIQTIKDYIDDNEDLLSSMIHITPYINITHYTFDRLGSAERAFEIFRTLGLRSLIVTGELEKRPLGVITRKDLYMLQEFGFNHHNIASSVDENDELKENLEDPETSSVSMS